MKGSMEAGGGDGLDPSNGGCSQMFSKPALHCPFRIDVDFRPLEDVVRLMAAAVRPYTPPPVEKEIELNDVAAGWDGQLSYRGDRVVIYIKDWRWRGIGEMEGNMFNRPKYHIGNCEWIRKKRAEGLHNRYVSSPRTSGAFEVMPKDYDGVVELRLNVCMYCLDHWDWKGCGGEWELKKEERRKVRDDFDLEEFVVKHEPDFLWSPRYTWETTLPGGYAEEWPEFSRKCRDDAGWMCWECRVWLGEHRNLLHCHHRNGDILDNRLTNIRVLCLECHSQQPMHRMNIDETTGNLLARLRTEQRRDVLCKCRGCGVALFKCRRLLRKVRNEQVGEESLTGEIVMCVECFADVTGQRMAISESDKALLAWLRKEQLEEALERAARRRGETKNGNGPRDQ